ncbi:MAG: NAD(P)-dependent oxidoreductase [Caldilineaceae bacterium]|nr:NAD(P)-dependent oxidoreductase [Caldilineaceae bacterium]
MTRVVMIGASGHVGTYLVPRLVEAGHDVVAISRGQRQPYQPHGAWRKVKQAVIDRSAAEQAGSFGDQILALQPDVVIDMICFNLESARHLVQALRGQVQHFLHCGTVWVHGPSVEVPTTEAQPRTPFGEYGIQKAAIEAFLLDEARRGNFPATCLHPGHIVGPGWPPLNPAGNFNPRVFGQLARGEEVALPHFGLETVHHVHADDVAQIFFKTMQNWSSAVGESFHAVSPAAVTLRGYAESVAGWFGRDANLRFLPWADWEALQEKEDAVKTWEHIAHSPNCSIEKGRRLLGYEPRYHSFEAIYESVEWMVEQGIVKVDTSAGTREEKLNFVNSYSFALAQTVGRTTSDRQTPATACDDQG